MLYESTAMSDLAFAHDAFEGCRIGPQTRSKNIKIPETSGINVLYLHVGACRSFRNCFHRALCLRSYSTSFISFSPTERFWVANFERCLQMPWPCQRAIEKAVSLRKWIANISSQHPPMRFCHRRRVQFCDDRAVFKLARQITCFPARRQKGKV